MCPINEFLSDFDNLSYKSDEWYERMEDAIKQYEQEFGGRLIVHIVIRNYKHWKNEFNRNI